MRKRQIRAYLVETLRKELQSHTEQPKTIVLHRDGRTYSSELEGAREAIDQLKREGLLHPDATITVVEISKSAPVSLRLFEVTEQSRRKLWVDNPQGGKLLLSKIPRNLPREFHRLEQRCRDRIQRVLDELRENPDVQLPAVGLRALRRAVNELDYLN